MTSELSKTFDPAEIEARWYAHWEANGLFRPERPGAEPFTIVNPPPNVTGSLHIGHALDNTLQDVVIRYERLRGKDALWVVGTDHAGIATQMVVERQMEERQDKRTNYTREQFVEKVWEWKEESGGTITRQLRRLGCSMDWSREQFTMDPHFTKAVLKTFVDLYNDGLIYRDKRLVNWDPKLKTAISDLEVETRETKGGFWRFSYPFADGSGAVEVATTRPETMLADMAVAVHPTDERYKDVIGKDILQPITGRIFKVVADEHADPELGSGVVKITPGHDFNDFEVGKRAGIRPAEMLNMFDAEAKVVQTADGLIPDEYIGMDRFDARDLVVQRMKEAGFLIPHVTKDKDGNAVEADFEPRTIQTPFGDRGGVVVEPWLTDQWYVDAEKLAVGPIEAVRSGAIEIVPKTWEKTFFHWMENIQPWTISRQLWWGHRIPAWYAEDGSIFVAGTEEEAQALAGEGVALHRDPDVLDTWFSSALWPFATLGWPDTAQPPRAGEVAGGAPASADGGDSPHTQALAETPLHHPADGPPPRSGEDLFTKHYPNNLLISGFDILFFWDARMMMMGMYNTGQIPWPRLYLHGLVRAADGAKMSKSKGNVVDPLGLIDKYGADALRFFMCAMESQGRDIKMDDKRVEGYRNFATKLWNATRFCQSNGITASTTIEAPKATLAVNRWIIGEVVETLGSLDKAMAELRFDAAANAIYHFVWDQFCDWYLELIKGNIDDETRIVAGWVLDQIYVMLHPFMPFITEELWSKQGDRANYPLITAKWPEPGAGVDAAAKAEVDWLIEFLTQLRSARTLVGVPPSARTGLYIDGNVQSNGLSIENVPDLAAFERLAKGPGTIRRIGRIDWIEPLYRGTRLNLETGLMEARTVEADVNQAVSFAVGASLFLVPLKDVIDIDAEKARLEKALAASTKEAKSLEGRLSNANFVERAAPEAVEKARADHAHHAGEVERLKAALARLG